MLTVKERLRAIFDESKLIMPAEYTLFKIDHYGAWSPKDKKYNGDTMQLSCTEWKENEWAITFAENYTNAKGWEVKEDYPKWVEERKLFVWVLIR